MGSEMCIRDSVILDHYHKILSEAEDFYRDLGQQLEVEHWSDLNVLLNAPEHEGWSSEEWADIVAAHRGFKAGMEILELLPAMARFTGFY